MTITFCGHSDYIKKELHREKILEILSEMVGDLPADILLGGYGSFDEFAYKCCLEYKKAHKNLTLIFVTPYNTISYQKNHLSIIKDNYDVIIYPEIEDKPKRFAITYRNRYMVDKCDCLIAYIDHQWGGAYNTYQYAVRKKKKIINLIDYYN